MFKYILIFMVAASADAGTTVQHIKKPKVHEQIHYIYIGPDAGSSNYWRPHTDQLDESMQDEISLIRRQYEDYYTTISTYRTYDDSANELLRADIQRYDRSLVIRVVFVKCADGVVWCSAPWKIHEAESE